MKGKDGNQKMLSESVGKHPSGQRYIGKPFVKGDPRAGRPKGCKDKFTNLKEGFLKAYEAIGGDEALAKWGKRNPQEFYKMISRMLPANVNFESPLNVNLNGSLTISALKSSAKAYKEADAAK